MIAAHGQISIQLACFPGPGTASLLQATNPSYASASYSGSSCCSRMRCGVWRGQNPALPGSLVKRTWTGYAPLVYKIASPAARSLCSVWSYRITGLLFYPKQEVLYARSS